MNLDELTLGQIKQVQNMCGSKEENSHPYKIGEKYLIRTVTMIYTGELVSVYKNELVIRDAAWIADTGRWEQALKDGTLKEVEPYPEGMEVPIGRGAILDAPLWLHDLPREQK